MTGRVGITPKSLECLHFFFFCLLFHRGSRPVSLLGKATQVTTADVSVSVRLVPPERQEILTDPPRWYTKN